MYCKSTILFGLLLGMVFIPVFAALATSVDRMSLCNLEGFSGETIEVKITLEGTDPEGRSGFWEAYYKKAEGDNSRMDITSWITIEPKNYTIKQEETKVFTIKVNIPKDAESGLWGATSEEAGKEGHSGERKTYVIFKDAITGGNVYSGLIIPISVKVLKSPNPLVPIINFVKQNITIIVLSIVIILLLAMLLLKKRKQGSKEI